MNPSISTVALFKQCPLQYKLHSIVGLRKHEDESAQHHLRFGSAWHRAMEVIYKAKILADELTDLLGGTKLRLPELTSEAAKAAFLEAYPRQLDESDNAKTRESGLAAIDSYFEKYRDEDRERWKVLTVEAPEMYDQGFVVHLDMVAEDLEHGGIYGFDFKTTKKALAYDFWGKFEPNSQVTRYIHFIKERYGSCEGFYIRATQFGYRSRMYKGEPAGFYVKHEQQLFNVNEAQIKTELESNLYWQEIIRLATELDQFGINTDHCRFCDYRPICSSGWTWENDSDLILNQYRQVCGEMTPTLRPCLLDREHEGAHTEDWKPESEMQVEVEV